MTEYKNDYKLGVGEILLCSKDTKGKFESLKPFMGKVMVTIGGGYDKIYIVEEKDRAWNEVKSIQSRYNLKNLFESKIISSTLKSQKFEDRKNSELNRSPELEEFSSPRNFLPENFDENPDENMHKQAYDFEPNNVSERSSNSYQSNFFKKSGNNNFSGTNRENNNGAKDKNQTLTKFKNLSNKNLEIIGEKAYEEYMGMGDAPGFPMGADDFPFSGEKMNAHDFNMNPAGDLNSNNNNINDFNSERDQDNETLNSFKNFNNNNNGSNQNKNQNTPNPNSLSGKKQTQNINSNKDPLSPISGAGAVPDSNTLYSNKQGRATDFSMHKSQTNNELNNQNNTKTSYQDKESQIVQLYKGKYHLIKLTQDGKVYGCGESYFGVVGLGGAQSAKKPVLIPNLSSKKIVQIACGMFHSLALSHEGDLYSWGMGFEGQLGLTAQYKCVSSPRYVKFFFSRPVKFIACGHNYSLCITYDNKLWGWGENKLGQLGLGKVQIVEKPTLIELLDMPGGQEGCMKSDTLLNGSLQRPYSGRNFNACFVSAGFAHSAVVTHEGFLLTFGLNIYGQLGLGHTHSVFEPKLIEKDENGDFMKKIVKVNCNSSGTFMITDEGKLYTCGSGEIGHGDVGVIKLPRLVNDNRVYSHIFCNDHSVVAFCPLRIISVSPNSGPASGNSILSIIGSALKDFPKLSVRFIFGGVARDVKANFDKISRTIFVKTPNFLELCPNLELPAMCKIQLTFDGHYFTEYKEQFLIYPTTIKISAIEPKCGPTNGGSQLSLKINIDNIPQNYLFSLTVGFQAKPVSSETYSTKKNRSKRGINMSFRTNDLEESRISIDDGKSTIGLNNPNSNNNNTTLNNNNNHNNKFETTTSTLINPMDVNTDNQLEKANWYCSFASYENGTMLCNIPKIDSFSQSQVEYNVDVSINGQQFSGFPMIYRFYEIKIDKMEPNISSIEGGLIIKIIGQGLFDSMTKKAKITSPLGERFSDMQWDRSDRALIMVSNPLLWITNDEDVIKKIPSDELYENYNFEVSITMNNVDWIYVGNYKYCDPKITNAIYYVFPDHCSLDNRLHLLASQDKLSAEEKIYIKKAPFPEDKKKAEEIQKKHAEDDHIFATVSKRPYAGLILYGDYFPNSQMMMVRFQAAHCEYDTIAFYKNKFKVACLIPEMPKLSPGEHELKIMFSVNGQQFYNTGKRILFDAPEPHLKFEDIMKLEEADVKNKGKNVKKR